MSGLLRRREVRLWVVLVVATFVAGCQGNGSSTTSATSPGNSPAASGSGATTNVMLSWYPPTDDTNGTPLNNLGGYKIYYGTNPQEYSNTITVSNPGLTSYVIDSLAVGATYYFAVTAVSQAGVESSYSPQVAATIS
jgi:fibronectin type 3 domain-containing protein